MAVNFPEAFGYIKDGVGTIAAVIAAVASYLTLRHVRDNGYISASVPDTCIIAANGIVMTSLCITNGYTYAWKLDRVEVLEPKTAMLLRLTGGANPRFDPATASRFVVPGEAISWTKPHYTPLGILLSPSDAPVRLKIKAIMSSTINKRRRITKVLTTTAKASSANVKG